MDLALTPKQLEIRERSRRYCDEHLLPLELTCDEQDGLTREQLDGALRARARRARCNAVNMPAEWGGQGYTCLEQVISQEQLGRSTNALWDVVWRPANVLRALHRASSASATSCPRSSGERRYAYAITEPGAGSDPSRLATTARRDGDGWVIDGEKWFVTVGDVADYLIVVADAEGHGPTTFLVDKDTPGRARAAPAALHARVRLRAPGVRVRGRAGRPGADPRRPGRGAHARPRSGSSRSG